MNKYKKELIFAAIGIILFVSIVLFVFVGDVASFDTAVFNAIASLRNDFMTVVFKIITTLADKYYTVIFVLLMILLLQNKDKNSYITITKKEKTNNLFNRFLPWIIFLLSVILISALFLVIKAIFQRARPIEWFLVTEDGYSFPSGHTATATILYGVIHLLILNSTQKNWLKSLSWFTSAVIIFLVGISRIYLGVHFATDVIGGLMLGGIVLSICNIFIKKYNIKIDLKKRLEKTNNLE